MLLGSFEALNNISSEEDTVSSWFPGRLLSKPDKVPDEAMEPMVDGQDQEAEDCDCHLSNLHPGSMCELNMDVHLSPYIKLHSTM